MSSSESLFVCYWVRNRKNDWLRKIWLGTIFYWTDKIKVLVTYGRNSMSDLANSSNAATNDVDGRIGNETWCKCECCAPTETSIESVCCQEIPEICKARFSGALCLYVSRSDSHFIPRYSMREKSINYLISTHIWSLPNQNKSFLQYNPGKSDTV